MAWEELWPLVLGFALSGAVQAVVPRKSMARLLGDTSPRSLTFATLFGIASSSCSYAAVALARSLFLKGASLTAAMAFELASTNLVIELGVILVVLMGWPFAAAEVSGGLIMVLLLALIFRLTLTRRLVEQARRQAEKGLAGRMEGHAVMDMSVGDGSLISRLFSVAAWPPSRVRWSDRWWPCSASCARSATCHWRRCCGAEASASAAWSASSLPT